MHDQGRLELRAAQMRAVYERRKTSYRTALWFRQAFLRGAEQFDEQINFLDRNDHRKRLGKSDIAIVRREHYRDGLAGDRVDHAKRLDLIRPQQESVDPGTARPEPSFCLWYRRIMAV